MERQGALLRLRALRYRLDRLVSSSLDALMGSVQEARHVAPV